MEGMSSFSANARTIQHPITIFGSTIQSSIEIGNSYKSSIDFNLCGRTYTFVITHWQGKGLGKCSVILYIHAPVHIYGVTYYSTTTTSDVVVAYNTSGPWNLMLSGHANY